MAESNWFAKHKVLTILAVIVVLIVLPILGLVCRTARLPGRVANGALNTMEGAIDRTFDADKALANYHQFRKWYQVYEKGKADAQLMQSSLGQLLVDYPTPITRTEDIRDSITDYKFKRDASLMNANRVAAEYNAATSNVTMAIFKGAWLDDLIPVGTKVNLPDTLELLTESNLAAPSPQ